MLLRVLKQFHDRETSELYKIGSVIDVREERGKEILNSPLKVAELAEVKETTESKLEEVEKTTESKGRKGRKNKENVE